MRNTDGKAVYFPGLNGIRFLAAALVIVHHIEQLKALYVIPNISSHPAIGYIGGLGVTLFFVLSGFLISFLLFKEHEETGTIGITNFYIRRGLRIWPLYYLIALGGFLAPHFLNFGSEASHHFPQSRLEAFLFILIMPNVALVLFGPHSIIDHLWSVGVEEQFYLMWPTLIKYVKKGKFPALLFLIVVGMWFLRKLLSILGGDADRFGLDQNAKAFVAHLKTFFYFFRIDCMAIGGIGAYVLQRNYAGILRVIFHKTTQVVLYTALIFFISRGTALPFGVDPAYSLFFIAIILNVATNPASILKLQNPLVNYLGKISYGLYMYHMMVILAVLKWLIWIHPANLFLLNFLLYALSTMALIGISACSFRFLENPFLNYKKKFTRILSGDQAAQPAPQG